MLFQKNKNEALQLLQFQTNAQFDKYSFFNKKLRETLFNYNKFFYLAASLKTLKKTVISTLNSKAFRLNENKPFSTGSTKVALALIVLQFKCKRVSLGTDIYNRKMIQKLIQNQQK